MLAPGYGLRLRESVLPVVRSPEPVAQTRQLSKYTLRVCGRKTTVAEYSVVKEPWKQSAFPNLFPARQLRPAYAPFGLRRATFTWLANRSSRARWQA